MLADFQAPKLEVTFKNGGAFSVRGATLEDIAVLMRDHLVDLEALIEIFSKDVNRDIAVAAFTQHAVGIIREAPGLVANVIAMCADEPDSVDKARSLSMPVQVEALKKIAELTFDEAGGAKKFVESLMPLLTSLRPPKP